jgi:hypothetical protein
MSTRVILLERLSRILDEVIDIDKVDAIPLKLNSRITFIYGDFEYGMVIENIGSENKNIFPKSFTLPQDMEGYYNFGFDMDGKTIIQEPKSYKEIAKPLAIISKSLIEWISKNNPILVNVFADHNSEDELIKKLNLYGGLLNREKSTLKNLGYYWDFYNSPKLGKSIYIQKFKK